MRIHVRIALLVTVLLSFVVAGIVGNLIWLERSKVRRDSEARVDALMEGVMRIAQEALSSQDELMLVSYLEFLMKDYQEMESAVVSRKNHTTVLGQARSELIYRTLTVVERTAAAYPTASEAPAPAAQAAGAVPDRAYLIQIGFSRTAIERQVRSAQLQLARQILTIAGIGLLLGIAGSFWLGRLLARPIVSLARAAKRIGEGDLDASVDLRGKDEFGELAGQFNTMASRIRDSIRFKEELMSTLTHELNNPLGGIRGFVAHLMSTDAAQNPEERLDAYQTLAQVADQMDVSIKNALHFFRTGTRPSVNLEPLYLNDVAAEVIRLLGPGAQLRGIALELSGGEPPILLRADRELLRRVVINLVSNALKYTPDNGAVRIRLAEDGGAARISVEDQGPGVAAQDRERIFTRFFRAAGPGGRPQRIPGSGLGLAIARQAVTLHGGNIWVESEVGKGSVFHVAIPKAGGSHASVRA